MCLKECCSLVRRDNRTAPLPADPLPRWNPALLFAVCLTVEVTNGSLLPLRVRPWILPKTLPSFIETCVDGIGRLLIYDSTVHTNYALHGLFRYNSHEVPGIASEILRLTL